AAVEKAMELSKQLREYGFFAEYDLMNRGIKAQMKYANKTGAVFTLVLGDNELAEGKAKLKDMETGEEKEILLDDKFTGNFDAVYFDKMMDSIEDAETVNAFQKLAEENK
ncbi:MAG: histidine--tRNA ligase, partial [Ruminococcus sp.]|nr:histidine--tRNA ligase [Ruminococcus sp.]